MTPFAKIVVIGAAAGFAYWASRDVETVDGVQRFTEAGAKKVLAALRTTSLGGDGEVSPPMPGAFVMQAVLGAQQSGFVDTVKFLNEVIADGMAVAVSKAILKPGAISGGEVFVAVFSPGDKPEFAGPDSSFAMLVN